MASAKSLSVLLLGSTGEVGSKVLLSALSSNQISTVYTAGRSSPSIPTTTPGFDKLKSIIIDFEKLTTSTSNEEEVNKLKQSNADVILITLGTTLKSAGSMENFIKIDREYVLSSAKAAKIEGKNQKIVYCSSGGASSSSPFPYLKSKGLTEEGLAASGYAETLIFRPGYLVVPGGRKEHRMIESFMGTFMNIGAKFSNAIQVETTDVGKAMINSVTGHQKYGQNETLAGKPVWSIGNAGILKLAKEE